MGLPEGMHELGPASGRVRVRTARAGVAARAGHDLLLEASRWRASLEIGPADGARCALVATVDARSLEVREATGGVKPLTERDRAEIERIVSEKVLHAASHPDIRFTSRSVQLGNSRLRVAGDLTLAGVTGPVAFTVEIEPAQDATRLRTRVALVQSQWGIRPYSGFLGALKVADRVEVLAEAVVHG